MIFITEKKQVVSNRNTRERPRKLTFKERQEMTQLEKDIAVLEAEKKQTEEALCSGLLPVDQLTEKSKRFPLL